MVAYLLGTGDVPGSNPGSGEIFYSKSELKIHVFEKHDMNRHQKSVEHEDELRRYICLDSSTALKSARTENKNLSFIKTEDDKNDTEVITTQSSLPLVNCSEIPQHTKFSQEQTPEFNVKTYYKKSKPLECQVCKITFSCFVNFQKHIIDGVHKKIKLFNCQVCKFSFEFEKSLQEHVRTAHEKLRLLLQT